ncbi:Pachytene checkpoint protein 2-like protein [Colletotrichum higginsianum]|uniref:Pachytene checkpoint protein 2-like protein n=1 Tax=Colletotrichum higginsianum TaxID=80884 RepID=A0A4V4N9V4_9PEZI|nr:Pachytene checkpoint protein 2-like protein [Colletotrichum higginsianum]
MSRTTQLPLASSAASSIVPLLGPTGSGKTTLAKALAQKVAIRLCATYATIRLVKAGSRQPYNFNHFARGALKDSSRLHILIIDDVETIAWSSKRHDAEQHMIETVRITNLFLAGLDVLRAVPNALAYATSSMDTMLDDGLLDRCSITANLTLPKAHERYEMLRRRLQDLTVGETEDNNPGSQVLRLARVVGNDVSARFMANVFTLAIMINMYHSTCDLSEAVGAVLRCIEQHVRKRSRGYVTRMNVSLIFSCCGRD